MKRRFILLAFLILVISSCAGQQYVRHSSSHLISYLYPNEEKLILKNNSTPILNIPLSVGIAFIPESINANSFTLTEVKKRALLMNIASRFREDTSVSTIEIIPELYLKKGNGFATIEQVADMYKVDIMALVSYEQVEIHENNRSSLAYFTILGAAMVKGDVTEFQTYVDTAIFDVKTRTLLFRASGVDSVSREHTAYGFEKDNRLMRLNSFSQASNKMTSNLKIELELFRTKIRNKDIVKLKYSSSKY